MGANLVSGGDQRAQAALGSICGISSAQELLQRRACGVGGLALVHHCQTLHKALGDLAALAQRHAVQQQRVSACRGAEVSAWGHAFCCKQREGQRMQGWLSSIYSGE